MTSEISNRTVVEVLVRALGALPGGATANDHLERFAAALADARSRWPDAPAPIDAGAIVATSASLDAPTVDAAPPSNDFVGYIVDQARIQPDLPAALPRLRLDDAFLAWWCATGASQAITAFEQLHADELRRLLLRFHRLDADELRQQLRVKLFLGSDNAPPRIREFSGFGFLANWFRVVATRTFLDAARTRQRERSDELPDDLLDALVDAKASPRSAALRGQVIAAIKSSMRAALASLPARDRTFLRHTLLDRLTLEQIAETYGVHRVTVSRAIGQARIKLRELALAHAVAELGVSPETLASAVRELATDLDMSLATLFPQQVVER